MAVKTTVLTRKFSYASISLNDPSPTSSPEEVKNFYAAQYPELLTALVEGPVTKNGVSVYTFTRAAGSKG